MRKDHEEALYRVYATECLKKLVGASASYYELITPVKPETRTPEEIVANIKNGLAKLTEENKE